MKLSLRNIATALLFSGFLHATAEAPDSTIVDRINASETIEVIQPAALQQRLIPNREADAATSANHATPAARSGFHTGVYVWATSTPVQKLSMLLPNSAGHSPVQEHRSALYATELTKH